MDTYERLQEILDTHPSGAPKSAVFDEILKILFTPEEVALAVHMSFAFRPVAELAQKAGLSEKAASLLLESMADKAIIQSRTKDGTTAYALLPTIPGLFEFPFMKGGGKPIHKRLGKLWEDYHHEALGGEFAGTDTPLMRVVPVQETIEDRADVLPYERARSLVDGASYLAVTECACRVSVDACDKPREVCLIFGPTAEFLVDRGYARSIDKQEAYGVLKTAADAGLVHTSNNSADRGNLICNCCPCCCTVLRGRTQLNIAHAFAPSAFTAAVDADLCTGCGVCKDERCPMGAIEMEGDVARVTDDRCIGCGVCVGACPTEAISLRERETRPEIAPTARDMGMTILTKKGKLARFLEIMKG
jgi:formate hydrogenlyase subunit 6/NADH:ubiquinone oxidoreductase subunit I